MLDYWAEVFQPHFGHPGHQRVRQTVYNLRSIRNYYVGRHDGAECDYEPSDALGEIARLLRRFSADDAARQVDELKRELGSLMYGQPTAMAQSAAGDNVVLTRDALAMLIADTVSQEVARQTAFPNLTAPVCACLKVAGRPPRARHPRRHRQPFPPVGASFDADAVSDGCSRICCWGCGSR